MHINTDLTACSEKEGYAVVCLKETGRLVPCKKWIVHLFVLRRAPVLLAPAQYLYSLYEDHKACQNSTLGCHVVDLISWVDCFYGWYIYVIQSYGNVYFVNCFLLKNQYIYEMDLFWCLLFFCVCVYIFEKIILCSPILDFGKIVKCKMSLYICEIVFHLKITFYLNIFQRW